MNTPFELFVYVLATPCSGEGNLVEEDLGGYWSCIIQLWGKGGPKRSSFDDHGVLGELLAYIGIPIRRWLVEMDSGWKAGSGRGRYMYPVRSGYQRWEASDIIVLHLFVAGL